MAVAPNEKKNKKQSFIVHWPRGGNCDVNPITENWARETARISAKIARRRG